MKIQTRYGRALAERGSSHPAAGFSLAEMMVVIVIIGLLATMVVPNVLRYLGNANSTKVEADMNQITTAISTYTIQNKMRPPESLEELINPEDGGGSYFTAKKMPLDPWGNEYVYERNGSEFELISYGRDQVPGGEGDDADIIWSELEEQ